MSNEKKPNLVNKSKKSSASVLPLTSASNEQGAIAIKQSKASRKLKKKRNTLSIFFMTKRRIIFQSLTSIIILFLLYLFLIILIQYSQNTSINEITIIDSKDIINSYRNPQTHEIEFQTKFQRKHRCDYTEVKFTLVSQLSEDRLWMIPYQCERWGYESPMSLVVLLNSNSTLTRKLILETILQPKCNPKALTVQLFQLSETYPRDDYPINYLRNKALSEVKTSHVLYIDVDFWISTNLFSVLHDSPSIQKFVRLNPKDVLVIPALSIPRMCREYRECPEYNIPAMPKTKQDILDLFQNRQVFPFDPTNRGGHGSTLYTKWFKSKVVSIVELPCIQSNRYEPYLAFKLCSDGLPPFQTVFTGYGKNKMTWVMQLRHAGYRFHQLNGVFLCHYPHLDSLSRQTWNNQDNGDWKKAKRAKNDEVFVQFREWLGREYQHEKWIETQICEDAEDDDARLWVEH